MFKYLIADTKSVGHVITRTGLLILCTLLAVITGACQKPLVWQDYRPANQDFTVKFPDKPNETTRTSPLGDDVKYPKVVWNGKGVTLDLTFAEIPDLRPLNRDETKEYYEYLRGQTISLNKSKLMESTDITVNGKLGNDFTEVRPGGKVTRFRLFLLGTKLLSLRAEQDVNILPMADTSSVVEQFMSSLSFPEKDSLTK